MNRYNPAKPNQGMFVKTPAKKKKKDESDVSALNTSDDSTHSAD
jgi:hypothetical protein